MCSHTLLRVGIRASARRAVEFICKTTEAIKCGDEHLVWLVPRVQFLLLSASFSLAASLCCYLTGDTAAAHDVCASVLVSETKAFTQHQWACLFAPTLFMNVACCCSFIRRYSSFSSNVAKGCCHLLYTVSGHELMVMASFKIKMCYKDVINISPVLCTALLSLLLHTSICSETPETFFYQRLKWSCFRGAHLNPPHIRNI